MPTTFLWTWIAVAITTSCTLFSNSLEDWDISTVLHSFESKLSKEDLTPDDVSLKYAEMGLVVLHDTKISKQSKVIKSMGYFLRARESATSDNHAMHFSWNLELARLMYELGRSSEAMSVIDAATKALDTMGTLHDFDHSTILALRGDVLMEQGDPLSASEMYNKSLALNPCMTPTYWKLVNGFKAQSDFNKTSKTLWHELARTMETIANDTIDAQGAFKEHCKTYTNMSFIRRTVEENETDTPDPSLAYWAVSSAYRQAGDQEKYVQYLQLAHRMDIPKLQTSPFYNMTHNIQQVKLIKSFFNQQYWPAAGEIFGLDDMTPVFIVGFFRSGSTLLETMLNAHPQVWAMGEDSVFLLETSEFHNNVHNMYQKHRSTSNLHSDSHGSNSGEWESGDGARHSAVEASADGEIEGGRAGSRRLRAFEEVYAEEVRRQAERVRMVLVREAAAARKQVEADCIFRGVGLNENATEPQCAKQKLTRVVDKMLTNYKHIGLIHLLFPKAVILHTMRDPLDTLFSCYNIKFGSPHAVWSLDVETLVTEYALYLEVMQHFRRELPGRVLDVSYEALVADPEGMMRAILLKLQLPWDAKVLRHHQQRRSVSTASFLQVKKKIYKSSVGAWTEYAGSEMITSITLKLKELLPKLRGLDALPNATSASALLREGQEGEGKGKGEGEGEEVDMRGALGSVRINWDLDPLFDYGLMMQSLAPPPPRLLEQLMTPSHSAVGATEGKGSSMEELFARLVAVNASARASVDHFSVSAHDRPQDDDDRREADTTRDALLGPLIERGQIYFSLGMESQALADVDVALDALHFDRHAYSTNVTIDYIVSVGRRIHWPTEDDVHQWPHLFLSDSAASVDPIDASTRGVDTRYLGVLRVLLSLRAAVLCASSHTRVEGAMLHRIVLLTGIAHTQSGDLDMILSPYAGFVRCLRESGDVSQEHWQALWKEMARAEEVQERGHRPPARSSWRARDVNSSSNDLVFTSSARASIYWALYLAADAVGNVSQAWRYLERGHEMARPAVLLSQAYNIRDSIAQTKAVLQRHRSGFWPNASMKVGSSSDMPVFVVGFFRSGSTLLETMLSAHPQVRAMGEDSPLVSLNSDHILRLAGNISSAKMERAALQKLLGELRSDVRSQSKSILQKMKACLALLNVTTSTPLLRVVDKMLLNFRHIGLIHLLFPKAVILHTMRDPLDTLFSCYNIKISSPSAVWSLDVETLVTEYALYLEVMQHFRRELPGRVLDVSYEALVADPEGMMRAILLKLQLPWDTKVLRHHQQNRPMESITASRAQVRRPVYVSSVGRWRRYSHHLQPLIRALQRHISQSELTAPLPWALRGEAVSGYDPNAGVSMNWNFDPDFDYDKMIDALSPFPKTARSDLHRQMAQQVPDQQAWVTSGSIVEQYLNRFASTAHARWLDEYFTASVERNEKMLTRFGAAIEFAVKEVNEPKGPKAKAEKASTLRLVLHARINRAQIFMALGKFNDALNDLTAALRYLCRKELSVAVVEGQEASLDASGGLKETASLLCPHRELLGRARASAGPLSKGSSRSVKDPSSLVSLDLSDVVLSTLTFFMGMCNQKVNQAAAAAFYFRRSIALNPQDLGIFGFLVNVLREERQGQPVNWDLMGQEMTLALQAHIFGLSERVNVNEDEMQVLPHVDPHQAGIYWALFVAADAVGNTTRAWRYLKKALCISSHRLLLSQAYNIRDSIAQTKAVLQRHRSGFWPNASMKVGLSSDMLVFVVGFFKSGSTLLETMLSAHPQVRAMGEGEGAGTAFGAQVRPLASALEDLSTEAAAAGELKDDILMRYNSTVQHHAKQVLNAFGTQHRKVVIHLVEGYKHIGLIHLLFPKAVILHTMRDPLDTLFSCLSSPSTESRPLWSLDMETLVTEYALYLEVMQHFRRELPGRVLDVSYEALVADPEGMMRAILLKLQLPWDAKVLRHHQQRRPESTESAPQPSTITELCVSSIGQWRRYAHELAEVIATWQVKMPRLQRLGALQSPSFISMSKVSKNGKRTRVERKVDWNWEMSPLHDYDAMITAWGGGAGGS